MNANSISRYSSMAAGLAAILILNCKPVAEKKTQEVKAVDAAIQADINSNLKDNATIKDAVRRLLQYAVINYARICRGDGFGPTSTLEAITGFLSDNNDMQGDGSPYKCHSIADQPLVYGEVGEDWNSRFAEFLAEINNGPNGKTEWLNKVSNYKITDNDPSFEAIEARMQNYLLGEIGLKPRIFIGEKGKNLDDEILYWQNRTPIVAALGDSSSITLKARGLLRKLESASEANELANRQALTPIDAQFASSNYYDYYLEDMFHEANFTFDIYNNRMKSQKNNAMEWWKNTVQWAVGMGNPPFMDAIKVFDYEALNNQLRYCGESRMIDWQGYCRDQDFSSFIEVNWNSLQQPAKGGEKGDAKTYAKVSSSEAMFFGNHWAYLGIHAVPPASISDGAYDRYAWSKYYKDEFLKNKRPLILQMSVYWIRYAYNTFISYGNDGKSADPDLCALSRDCVAQKTDGQMNFLTDSPTIFIEYNPAAPEAQRFRILDNSTRPRVEWRNIAMNQSYGALPDGHPDLLNCELLSPMVREIHFDFGPNSYWYDESRLASKGFDKVYPMTLGLPLKFQFDPNQKIDYSVSEELSKKGIQDLTDVSASLFTPTNGLKPIEFIIDHPQNPAKKCHCDTYSKVNTVSGEELPDSLGNCKDPPGPATPVTSQMCDVVQESIPFINITQAIGPAMPNTSFSMAFPADNELSESQRKLKEKWANVGAESMQIYKHANSLEEICTDFESYTGPLKNFYPLCKFRLAHPVMQDKFCVCGRPKSGSYHPGNPKDYECSPDE